MPTSKGGFLFAKAVAPAMKAKGARRIVTISSWGATTLTGIHSYTAVRHRQIGLIRELFGIAINSVVPGFKATCKDYERHWNSWLKALCDNFVNTIAMRRVGAPQTIANAVTVLASDQASWIAGQTITRHRRPFGVRQKSGGAS